MVLLLCRALCILNCALLRLIIVEVNELAGVLVYDGFCTILTTIPIHAILSLRIIDSLMLEVTSICAMTIIMLLNEILSSLFIARLSHDCYIVGQDFHRLF